MKSTLIRLAALSAFALAAPFNAYAIGALAVDDAVGESEPGYGFSTGHATEAEAKAAALRECRKAGNDGCKVIGWFRTCGAYAVSKNYYGYGYGATISAANRMARDQCGNAACRVVISECEE